MARITPIRRKTFKGKKGKRLAEGDLLLLFRFASGPFNHPSVLLLPLFFPSCDIISGPILANLMALRYYPAHGIFLILIIISLALT